MVLFKSVFRIYLYDHVSVHIFKKNKRSDRNKNSYLEWKGGWHEKKGRYTLPSCLVDDTWSSTLTFIPEEKEAHRATRQILYFEFTHSISKDREWGWNVSLSTFVVTGPFFFRTPHLWSVCDFVRIWRNGSVGEGPSLILLLILTYSISFDTRREKSK